MKIFAIIGFFLMFNINTFEYFANVNAKMASYNVDYENDKNVLFTISHNKSPNIVIYKANCENNNMINTKNPFDVFWLMKTKGNKVENITFIEKKTAFGFKVEQITYNQKYRIRLNALEEKYIDIVRNNSGKFDCFINIENTLIKLNNIFVKFEYGLLGPDIEYLDFKGVNAKTGQKIIKRKQID